MPSGGEIRGLSIKFDADFSDFKKGMRQADKDIGSTQKQLKSLQYSLKFKFDSNKFSKAQADAQKALEATEQKAELLRQRLSQIEEAGVTDKNRDEYNYLAEQLEKTELNAERLKNTIQDLNKIKLDNLTKGFDDAQKKAEKAAKATKGLSVAAAGVAAGLVATGIQAIKTGDEIATLATKYNTTATAIQRFQYVALQTDTESEDLYKGLVKIRAGLAAVATDATSKAGTALQKLGIDFSKIGNSEDQFYAIIEALSNMEDQTQMVAIANDVFGEKLANNLLPMIRAGSSAIREYYQEFNDLGALTDDQVAKLSEFDNVMNKLKTQFGNVAIQLGTSFLPLLQQFANILEKDVLPLVSSFVDWFSNLDEGTKKYIVTGLLLIAALSPMLKLFSGIMSGISMLIKWFAKLEIATLKLYAKWALLAASVGALFYVLTNWSNMNPVQKIIGLLGALSAAALSAAVAFGVFHSAWSLGIAVAGIVAGIATAVAAVKSAAKEIGAEVSFDTGTYNTAVSVPSYSVPESSVDYGTVNTNTYNDNSNVTINIEKNEYMNEDDIIRAVNRGLKMAKQART